MKDSYKYKKWNRWLEQIKAELQSLLIKKHIFWEVQRIIKANKKIQVPSEFYDWLGRVYTTDALVGIRRFVDRDKRSISLLRLMSEILAEPHILSRNRYLRLYGRDSLPLDLVNKYFDAYAGKGKKHISRRMVRSDISILKKATARLKRFTDKQVAHSNLRKMKLVPKYDEVNDALNALDALVKKYILILKATAYTNLMPTFQYDWERIFYLPWIDRK